jgi:short-subunit dehydrogenase
MHTLQDKTIWIIGASSGIGQAVARQLDAEGAKLVLSARRKQSLIELNQELGDKHIVFPLDVTDSQHLVQLAESIIQQLNQLDSVLFFAASYTPSSVEQMDIEQAKQIVDVNLMGALNTVNAVLPIMKQQGHGQIALCASVAGYTGLPNGQPYSATKAALINLAESLRIEQQANNIDIKVINPGFVSTPMTEKNQFKMPMIVTPEKAAKAISKGLTSQRFEIHFPKRFTLLLKLLRLLPYWLYFLLIRNQK